MKNKEDGEKTKNKKQNPTGHEVHDIGLVDYGSPEIYTMYTVYKCTPDIAIIESMELSHGALQGQCFSLDFSVSLQVHFAVVADTLTHVSYCNTWSAKNLQQLQIKKAFSKSLMISSCMSQNECFKDCFVKDQYEI